MTYPPEFSAQARVRVEGELLRAKELRGRSFNPYRFPAEEAEWFLARIAASGERAVPPLLPDMFAIIERRFGRAEAASVWDRSVFWLYVFQVFQVFAKEVLNQARLARRGSA
jgi:hypothetical protein